jgi:hypothetical protein
MCIISNKILFKLKVNVNPTNTNTAIMPPPKDDNPIKNTM